MSLYFSARRAFAAANASFFLSFSMRRSSLSSALIFGASSLTIVFTYWSFAFCSRYWNLRLRRKDWRNVHGTEEHEMNRENGAPV